MLTTSPLPLYILPTSFAASIFLRCLPLILFVSSLQEMPIMNGFEATKEIRRREKDEGSAKPVVIIGLSGNARGVFSELGAGVGMDDYVVSERKWQKRKRKK